MDPRIRVQIHTKVSWIRNTGDYSMEDTSVRGQWQKCCCLVLVLLVPGTLELGDAALCRHLDRCQVPVTDASQQPCTTKILIP
jgi:hypothetical protein